MWFLATCRNWQNHCAMRPMLQEDHWRAVTWKIGELVCHLRIFQWLQLKMARCRVGWRRHELKYRSVGEALWTDQPCSFVILYLDDQWEEWFMLWLLWVSITIYNTLVGAGRHKLKRHLSFMEWSHVPWPLRRLSWQAIRRQRVHHP